MSNLLFSLVGAAIGSAFGMPALGFALGSAVGGSHHRAPSGTSLNDLKVQTATYGIGIPQVYGRYRLSGNMLWALDIQEVKGPKDHYSYYGYFAIGLCQGPIAGIRRIWADGKELFNDPYFLGEGIRSHYPPELRFYCGDESQQPDPLIEAHQGKGQVPAFRGLAYLVFENLPLAAFNNRLPTLQVEVVQAVLERPATPTEARQKSYFEEKTVLQNGEFQHFKSEQRQPALPPGTLMKAPGPVRLAEVVESLCCQSGFTPEQIDTHLLTASLQGFVVTATSARDVLAPLMQVYGFDMVEVGRGLACIPWGGGAKVCMQDADVAQEEGADGGAVTLTRLPAVECLHTVTLVFNEAAQYSLVTQTAQRMNGQRSERVELPLVLSPEEAAALAEGRVENAWDHRLQYSFSLPRAYAGLGPGDRLQWQDRILRVVRVAYGSPGLVQVHAVEERGEETPAWEKGGEGDN